MSSKNKGPSWDELTTFGEGGYCIGMGLVFRQGLHQDVFLLLCQTVREFDVELDDYIALFASLFGIGKTFAGNALLSVRVHDFRDLQWPLAAVECRHRDRRADQSLRQ